MEMMMMPWEKPRKRSRLNHSEKAPKKTKAFKCHLKNLDKRKRHFIHRMITRYQMTEPEAIARWTRIHPESPEDEVVRMMRGEPEIEDKLPEEKRDFMAEAMVGSPEVENNE